MRNKKRAMEKKESLVDEKRTTRENGSKTGMREGSGWERKQNSKE